MRWYVGLAQQQARDAGQAGEGAHTAREVRADASNPRALAEKAAPAGL